MLLMKHLHHNTYIRLVLIGWSVSSSSFLSEKRNLIFKCRTIIYSCDNYNVCEVVLFFLNTYCSWGYFLSLSKNQPMNTLVTSGSRKRPSVVKHLSVFRDAGHWIKLGLLRVLKMKYCSSWSVLLDSLIS